MTRACIEVDLGRLRENLARIRTRVAPAEHLLVVKDDAYGHGLAAVVHTAVEAGVGWFGTFDVATALAVRAEAGPTARIIAWTVYGAEDLHAALEADIDLGLGSRRLLAQAAAYASERKARARVHLKIDTGLHRNGIRPEQWQDAVAEAQRAVAAGAIDLVGVWSHIAEASDEEDERSRACFQRAADAFAPARPLRHLAASAAGFTRPEFRFDLVRIGAFAYGIRPAGGPGDRELGLKPVATLSAPVLDVDERGAVVGVGSLDGVDSRLVGRLEVTTPGGVRRVEEIGPTHLRVAPWPQIGSGQRVQVLGGGAPMTMTDAAELIDTIGEEVMLRLNAGLPRHIL